MNRLQTQLRRLYLPDDRQAGVVGQTEAADPELIDVDGRVRAMVVELECTAGLDAVAAIWQGVQDDLGLPAPAMAISGVDAFQVWFSLMDPVPVARARAFLDALRVRYLDGIVPESVRLMPSPDPSAARRARHARPVPAPQPGGEHWSAFIVPGLAGMFTSEPWLDMPPGIDAQADLLMRLKRIEPADFLTALDRLHAFDPPADPGNKPDVTADAIGEPPGAATFQEVDRPDPKRFLLSVMNDRDVDLRLRIEAAKALLPYFEPVRQR